MSPGCVRPCQRPCCAPAEGSPAAPPTTPQASAHCPPEAFLTTPRAGIGAPAVLRAQDPLGVISLLPSSPLKLAHPAWRLSQSGWTGTHATVQGLLSIWVLPPGLHSPPPPSPAPTRGAPGGAPPHRGQRTCDGGSPPPHLGPQAAGPGGELQGMAPPTAQSPGSRRALPHGLHPGCQGIARKPGSRKRAQRRDGPARLREGLDPRPLATSPAARPRPSKHAPCPRPLLTSGQMLRCPLLSYCLCPNPRRAGPAHTAR